MVKVFSFLFFFVDFLFLNIFNGKKSFFKKKRIMVGIGILRSLQKSTKNITLPVLGKAQLTNTLLRMQ